MDGRWVVAACAVVWIGCGVEADDGEDRLGLPEEAEGEADGAEAIGWGSDAGSTDRAGPELGATRTDNDDAGSGWGAGSTVGYASFQAIDWEVDGDGNHVVDPMIPGCVTNYYNSGGHCEGATTYFYADSCQTKWTGFDASHTFDCTPWQPPPTSTFFDCQEVCPEDSPKKECVLVPGPCIEGMNPVHMAHCDCDGAFDCPEYAPDEDGDGQGSYAQALNICGTPPDGFVATFGDCNDLDESTHAGAPELCDDGVLNDCSVVFCDDEAAAGCVEVEDYCGSYEIDFVAGEITITWAGDCILVESTDLQTWTDYAGPVTQSGCQRSVSFPPDGGGLFGLRPPTVSD